MFIDTFMSLALDKAKEAFEVDEVPVGCVIVKNGQILSIHHNRTRKSFNPFGHAEILCLQEACQKTQSINLEGCDLYVTLEPCPMCAQAISLSRIKRLYFGAYDIKGGGVDHGPKIYNHASSFHKPEVYGGISEGPCAKILSDFFKAKR